MIASSRVSLVILGLLVLVGLRASAQQPSLSGTVADPHGHAQGVVVTLTGAGGGRETVTDHDGRYQLGGLPAGTYLVTFAREGFEPRTESVFLGGSPVTLNVSLTVSRLSETVAVTATLTPDTASKLNVPASDVPVQVSTVSLEAIQDQGLNDLVTALRNVSGATTQKFWGTYENYTIRGFHSLGNTMLVLTDGMRIDGERLNNQIHNVERIEVLKGPSSSLFGSQGLAGTINVIRKSPQARPSYDVLYRAGRFNTHQIGAGATGPLGSDAWLYRADVSYDRADNWRDAGARRFNVSPVVTWLVNDGTRLKVQQAVSHDDYDGDAGVPYDALDSPLLDRRRRLNTPGDFIRYRDSQSNVIFTTGAGGLRFRNNLSYRYSREEYHAVDGASYQAATNLILRPRFYVNNTRRPLQNQTEMTGNFALGGMDHTFLVGYEFLRFTNEGKPSTLANAAATPLSLATYEETSAPIADFTRTAGNHLRNTVNGVYWQDQISVAPKVQINVGGRYDDYTHVRRSDSYAQGQLVSRGSDIRREQPAYTYRAGIVVSPTDNQQIYASSASSFTPVTQISSDGRALEPEYGRSFELGHRLQTFGGRVSFSTAFYHLVRRNVLIAYPNQVFEQAGQQSSRGIDVDATGSVGRGMTLVANYGYTIPRFDRFLTSNGTVDLSGNQPRMTQRHAANAWLTKVWSSGLAAGGGIRYAGKTFINDTEDRPLDAWTTVNAMIGFRKGRYDWTLNVENLFDAEYLLPGAYGSLVYPAAPVTVFTTIRFHFD